MDKPLFTTKFILDFNLLKNFGCSGAEGKPVDVSPFTFIVFSDYSNLWDSCRDIVKLMPDAELSWSLETPGYTIDQLTVNSFELVFSLIGYNTTGCDMVNEWNKVFIISPEMVQTDGTLRLTTGGYQKSKQGMLKMGVGTQTVPDIGLQNNLTFTVSAKLTDVSTGQNYFIKIDPLIKNNSKGEEHS